MFRRLGTQMGIHSITNANMSRLFTDVAVSAKYRCRLLIGVEPHAALKD
jgi:hypothetical protein